MITKAQIKLIKSLELKKYRKKYGLFIAERPKLVIELLKENFKIHSIFCTKDFEKEIHGIGIEVQLVTSKELKNISGLDSPNEVVAIFQIPEGQIPQNFNDELYIALDGIRDPGNLGTIIRTADWFGVNQIFCSMDCVDAFNPKVVEASMGSIARVKVAYDNLTKLIESFPSTTMATATEGTPLKEATFKKPCLIIIGNEGQGIRPNIMEKAKLKVKIKGYGKAESLNAAIATGIILYHLKLR